jgi:iron(III) transport system permease protein
LSLVLLPVAALLVMALAPAENIWPHLAAYVLPSAMTRTFLVMAGVGAATLAIGTGTAWLVTMYRFPGRNLADWLLILPLAMPTYIIAYAYADLLDFSGPAQAAVRWLGGWRGPREYWFPEIRSTGGAVLVLSLVLYPYVYLSARASFLLQSACVLEVARTLGRTPRETFFAVALPLARPALAAGTTLALMECLNDIGAMQYLGVRTLTVAVYDTWLNRDNLGGAAQIAAVMLTLVVTLLLAERALRGGRLYHHTTNKYRPIPFARVRGFKGRLTLVLCLLPPILGFFVPVLVLLGAAVQSLPGMLSGPFWTLATHSIVLSAMGAATAVAPALILAYASRVAPNGFTRPAVRLAGFGYAMPGTILALGLLIPLAALDNRIDDIARSWLGVSTGLMITGSMLALVLAYGIRFMAVSLGAVEEGLGRISPNLDAAARTLGSSALAALGRVHVPILRPAIGAAALLVFVDCMKELPATLLLAPLNFRTLSTHVFDLARDERFTEAGLAALTIVGIGLLPVLVLHRAMTQGRAGQRDA